MGRASLKEEDWLKAAPRKEPTQGSVYERPGRSASTRELRGLAYNVEKSVAVRDADHGYGAGNRPR